MRSVILWKITTDTQSLRMDFRMDLSGRSCVRFGYDCRLKSWVWGCANWVSFEWRREWLGSLVSSSGWPLLWPWWYWACSEKIADTWGLAGLYPYRAANSPSSGQSLDCRVWTDLPFFSWTAETVWIDCWRDAYHSTPSWPVYSCSAGVEWWGSDRKSVV